MLSLRVVLAGGYVLGASQCRDKYSIATRVGASIARIAEKKRVGVQLGRQ
jgi:hypothetical protein